MANPSRPLRGVLAEGVTVYERDPVPRDEIHLGYFIGRVRCKAELDVGGRLHVCVDQPPQLHFSLLHIDGRASLPIDQLA